MIRSASGTYSLPSACMKSYWVSTSQKMTRAMAGNLSEDTGACQQQGGRTKSLPVLELEDYGDLITAVVARTPHTVRPYLEGEVLALGGHEARLQKERRLAGQREDFGQPLGARLGDQGREQRAADARPLPIRPDGEGGELRELSRVNLERSATDDLARRGLRDDVFLDVAAEVVVAARQQVAGLNVRSHEGFELRHVRQHRFPQRYAGERGAGSRERCDALLPVDGYCAQARISSRIATPRSSSGTVITSGGSRRITCGPAVTTNSPRSRAAATIGAAGSASSSPHMSPRPRTSRTRGAPAASRARCAPRHASRVAQLAQESQPLGVHRAHPALPLHRLDDDRRRAGRRHGVIHGRPVLARDDADARHERLERLAIVGTVGGREGREQASVKRARKRDDLALARPLAGELECGLVRLGPRVTEEGAVGEGTRDQLLGEPLAGLTAVEVGNVAEPPGEGALESHPDDGMIVAERVAL